MNTLLENTREYTAIEIREIMQQVFPTRKLVLSQLTFFGHLGAVKATGESFKRGRRCYHIADLLPFACIISLKEQGIPLKNIKELPTLLQNNITSICSRNSGCKVSGYGDTVSLTIDGEMIENAALDEFLALEKQSIFWSFDLSTLVNKLNQLTSTTIKVGEQIAA